MRRSIYILIGVVLISFGIGIYSLIYYDNFRLSNIISFGSYDSNVSIGDNGIEVVDGKSRVNIGWSGIEVKDGDDYVKVGLDGIKVTDGKDNVNIGFDGIKVDDGKKKVNIGGFGNWFGINWKKLNTYNIDEEKTEDINGVKSIEVISSFVDVKLVSEDRDDVRIHYHGSMRANVKPELEVEKIGSKLEIKLTTNKNSHTVTESNVILEVILPHAYKEDINIATSSGDIYGLAISGKYLDLTSSSGDISFNKIEGDRVSITTSSGDVTTKEISGDLDITSSSGDIVITVDNKTKNVNISTSSGDVDVFVGLGASLIVSGTTSSGDVRSNTPISVHQDRTGRFDFTIGDGKNNMKITTSSGDVTFK